MQSLFKGRSFMGKLKEFSQDEFVGILRRSCNPDNCRSTSENRARKSELLCVIFILLLMTVVLLFVMVVSLYVIVVSFLCQSLMFPFERLCRQTIHFSQLSAFRTVVLFGREPPLGNTKSWQGCRKHWCKGRQFFGGGKDILREFSKFYQTNVYVRKFLPALSTLYFLLLCCHALVKIIWYFMFGSLITQLNKVH